MFTDDTVWDNIPRRHTGWFRRKRQYLGGDSIGRC